MSGIGSINLKVAVVDSDRYALNAIRAYCAWDRRTRVVQRRDSLDAFLASCANRSAHDLPDVLVLDANHLGGPAQLEAAISELCRTIDGLLVICLAQFADLDLIHAAAEAGARAYLLKEDVRIHIAWAICQAYALRDDDFLISGGVVVAGERLSHRRLRRAVHLAPQRKYPGMSNRIREAIELFAIEGMSHSLVADEMGISVNTVRGYIKDAYETLEAYTDDADDYPADMSQQEIAFMRITALDI